MTSMWPDFFKAWGFAFAGSLVGLALAMGIIKVLS